MPKDAPQSFNYLRSGPNSWQNRGFRGFASARRHFFYPVQIAAGFPVAYHLVKLLLPRLNAIVLTPARQFFSVFDDFAFESTFRRLLLWSEHPLYTCSS